MRRLGVMTCCPLIPKAVRGGWVWSICLWRRWWWIYVAYGLVYIGLEEMSSCLDTIAPSLWDILHSGLLITAAASPSAMAYTIECVRHDTSWVIYTPRVSLSRKLLASTQVIIFGWMGKVKPCLAWDPAQLEYLAVLTQQACMANWPCRMILLWTTCTAWSDAPSLEQGLTIKWWEPCLLRTSYGVLLSAELCGDFSYLWPWCTCLNKWIQA